MKIIMNYPDGSLKTFASIAAMELHDHPERRECGPMKRTMGAMLASVRKRAFGATAKSRAKGALEYVLWRNAHPYKFEGGEERALDSCFEMNDGKQVCLELRKMAERCPAVLEAFREFDPSWVDHVFFATLAA